MTEKRKTYSLDPDLARDLARYSLLMGEKLECTVPKQDILDELVGLLEDSKIFAKIIKKIKTNKKNVTEEN